MVQSRDNIDTDRCDAVDSAAEDSCWVAFRDCGRHQEQSSADSEEGGDAVTKSIEFFTVCYNCVDLLKHEISVTGEACNVLWKILLKTEYLKNS